MKNWLRSWTRSPASSSLTSSTSNNERKIQTRYSSFPSQSPPPALSITEQEEYAHLSTLLQQCLRDPTDTDGISKVLHHISNVKSTSVALHLCHSAHLPEWVLLNFAQIPTIPAQVTRLHLECITTITKFCTIHSGSYLDDLQHIVTIQCHIPSVVLRLLDYATHQTPVPYLPDAFGQEPIDILSDLFHEMSPWSTTGASLVNPVRQLESVIALTKVQPEHSSKAVLLAAHIFEMLCKQDLIASPELVKYITDQSLCVTLSLEIAKTLEQHQRSRTLSYHYALGLCDCLKWITKGSRSNMVLDQLQEARFYQWVGRIALQDQIKEQDHELNQSIRGYTVGPLGLLEVLRDFCYLGRHSFSTTSSPIKYVIEHHPLVFDTEQGLIKNKNAMDHLLDVVLESTNPSCRVSGLGHIYSLIVAHPLNCAILRQQKQRILYRLLNRCTEFEHEEQTLLFQIVEYCGAVYRRVPLEEIEIFPNLLQRPLSPELMVRIMTCCKKLCQTSAVYQDVFLDTKVTHAIFQLATRMIDQVAIVHPRDSHVSSDTEIQHVLECVALLVRNHTSSTALWHSTSNTHQLEYLIDSPVFRRVALNVIQHLQDKETTQNLVQRVHTSSYDQALWDCIRLRLSHSHQVRQDWRIYSGFEWILAQIASLDAQCNTKSDKLDELLSLVRILAAALRHHPENQQYVWYHIGMPSFASALELTQCFTPATIQDILTALGEIAIDPTTQTVEMGEVVQIVVEMLPTPASSFIVEQVFTFISSWCTDTISLQRCNRPRVRQVCLNLLPTHACHVQPFLQRCIAHSCTPQDLGQFVHEIAAEDEIQRYQIINELCSTQRPTHSFLAFAKTSTFQVSVRLSTSSYSTSVWFRCPGTDFSHTSLLEFRYPLSILRLGNQILESVTLVLEPGPSLVSVHVTHSDTSHPWIYGPLHCTPLTQWLHLCLTHSNGRSFWTKSRYCVYLNGRQLHPTIDTSSYTYPKRYFPKSTEASELVWQIGHSTCALSYEIGRDSMISNAYWESTLVEQLAQAHPHDPTRTLELAVDKVIYSIEPDAVVELNVQSARMSSTLYGKISSPTCPIQIENVATTIRSFGGLHALLGLLETTHLRIVDILQLVVRFERGDIQYRRDALPCRIYQLLAMVLEQRQEQLDETDLQQIVQLALETKPVSRSVSSRSPEKLATLPCYDPSAWTSSAPLVLSHYGIIMNFLVNLRLWSKCAPVTIQCNVLEWLTYLLESSPRVADCTRAKDPILRDLAIDPHLQWNGVVLQRLGLIHEIVSLFDMEQQALHSKSSIQALGRLIRAVPLQRQEMESLALFCVRGVVSHETLDQPRKDPLIQSSTVSSKLGYLSTSNSSQALLELTCHVLQALTASCPIFPIPLPFFALGIQPHVAQIVRDEFLLLLHRQLHHHETFHHLFLTHKGYDYIGRFCVPTCRYVTFYVVCAFHWDVYDIVQSTALNLTETKESVILRYLAHHCDASEIQPHLVWYVFLALERYFQHTKDPQLCLSVVHLLLQLSTESVHLSVSLVRYQCRYYLVRFLCSCASENATELIHSLIQLVQVICKQTIVQHGGRHTLDFLRLVLVGPSACDSSVISRYRSHLLPALVHLVDELASLGTSSDLPKPVVLYDHEETHERDRDATDHLLQDKPSVVVPSYKENPKRAWYPSSIMSSLLVTLLIERLHLGLIETEIRESLIHVTTRMLACFHTTNPHDFVAQIAYETTQTAYSRLVVEISRCRSSVALPLFQYMSQNSEVCFPALHHPLSRLALYHHVFQHMLQTPVSLSSVSLLVVQSGLEYHADSLYEYLCVTPNEPVVHLWQGLCLAKQRSTFEAFCRFWTLHQSELEQCWNQTMVPKAVRFEEELAKTKAAHRSNLLLEQSRRSRNSVLLEASQTGVDRDWTRLQQDGIKGIRKSGAEQAVHHRLHVDQFHGTYLKRFYEESERKRQSQILQPLFGATPTRPVHEMSKLIMRETMYRQRLKLERTGDFSQIYPIVQSPRYGASPSNENEAEQGPTRQLSMAEIESRLALMRRLSKSSIKSTSDTEEIEAATTTDEEENQDTLKPLESSTSPTSSDPPIIETTSSPHLDDVARLLRLVDPMDKVRSEGVFSCALVSGLDRHTGLIVLATHHLYFVAGLEMHSDGTLQSLPRDPSVRWRFGTRRHPVTGRLEVLERYPIDETLETEQISIQIAYTSLTQLHRRRFEFQARAVEVFCRDGFNCLVVFPSMALRDTFYKGLVRVELPGLVYNTLQTQELQTTTNTTPRPTSTKTLSRSTEEKLRHQWLKSVTQQWCEGKCTNFAYLMFLNTLADRSYNDLTQFPVFPWIVAQYETAALDLSTSSTFRDLTKPMGALGDGSRAAEFQKRYETWEDPEIPPFHYGSHYSSSAIVLYYLLRLEPFTRAALQLQGGKFDHADRLFRDIGQSYANASGAGGLSDCKELIPEFFYLPEFLQNINQFELGQTQRGRRVDHVHLPKWARGSSYLFIRLHRMALEARYVSQTLHRWIDLVFGYAQQGPVAHQSQNVFYHLTYEGAIDLESSTMEEFEKKAYIDQINEFGQCPKQLFTKPHPSRGVGIEQDTKERKPTVSCAASQLYPRAITASPECCTVSNSVMGHPIATSGAPTCTLPTPVVALALHHTRLVIVRGPNRTLWPFIPKHFVQFGTTDHSVRVYKCGTRSTTSEEESEVSSSNEAEYHLVETIKATSRARRITCLAVAEQQGLVVTGGQDGIVMVWRIETKPTRNVTKRSSAAAFSWTSSELEWSFVTQLVAHRHPIKGLTICQSSATLCSWSQAQDRVLVWDLHQFRLLQTLSQAQIVTFDERRSEIVTAHHTHLTLYTVNGVCLATNTAQLALYPHLPEITALEVAKEPEYMRQEPVVITGHRDGSVRCWEIEINVLEKELDGVELAQDDYPEIPLRFRLVHVLAPRARYHKAAITCCYTSSSQPSTLWTGDANGAIIAWTPLDTEVRLSVTVSCARCRHRFGALMPRIQCALCGGMCCSSCTRFKVCDLPESVQQAGNLPRDARCCPWCFERQMGKERRTSRWRSDQNPTEASP